VSMSSFNERSVSEMMATGDEDILDDTYRDG
jgi:hypothetical protein